MLTSLKVTILTTGASATLAEMITAADPYGIGDLEPTTNTVWLIANESGVYFNSGTASATTAPLPTTHYLKFPLNAISIANLEFFGDSKSFTLVEQGI